MHTNTRKLFQRTTLSFSAVVLIAGGTMVPSSASALSTDNSKQELTTTINQILADKRLEGASVGVLVRNAQSGEVLYSKNPSTLLTPASNTKLYSSSAALQSLGTNYKFATILASTGKIEEQKLKGNLYLKGTGDPTMQAADYDQLAAKLAATGIKTISGKLIADDTYFDDRRLGYGWEWDSSPYYFQPEISALTVAANSNYDLSALNVEVKPGKIDKKARISTTPATDYVMIQNNTTTTAPGTATAINIERQMGNNTIVVSGTIAVDAAAYQDISTISDPTSYAASIFKDALMKHGITLKENEFTKGATPTGATILTKRESAPLSSILTPFMKLSNNGIAEILVKSMGKKNNSQGTWDNGLVEETSVLKSQFGVDTSKLRFVDGSGLSTYNGTSTQRTTDLLIELQQQPWFDTWYNSLPVAGNPDPLVGGTLRARMQNTAAANNLRAKTGTLDSVSAMSGYVTSADGERLVFSIMEDHFLASSPKPLEDAIGVALASYSRNDGVSNQTTIKEQGQRQEVSKSRFE
jgi:serine-type D-Ala-D-Ala carboxypeptidase/endopeptidase (penicillin-binding protein 4)